jgi:hypothetical protein
LPVPAEASTTQLCSNPLLTPAEFSGMTGAP